MGILEMILAILGSNVATGIVTAMVSRRKSVADAVQVETSSKLDIARAAMEYADKIEKSFLARVNDLANEIGMLKVENIRLREKIDALIVENTNLRIEVGRLTSRKEANPGMTL